MAKAGIIPEGLRACAKLRPEIIRGPHHVKIRRSRVFLRLLQPLDLFRIHPDHSPGGTARAARALAPCPGGGRVQCGQQGGLQRPAGDVHQPGQQAAPRLLPEGLGGLGRARGRHRHHATGSPDQQRQGHAGCLLRRGAGPDRALLQRRILRLLGWGHARYQLR